MRDIRLIKLADAQEIYRARFWDLVRSDDLPLPSPSGSSTAR
jgi:lysozyme family protein